jgi:glycosyltransferase involved in cell wall biosynthesis
VNHRPERLSIIVPVYNEAGTSRAVIDRLLAVDLPLPREILIVNDGSTDGTGPVLDTAVCDGLPVTVIHAARNGGKGSAIRQGLSHATGSIVAVHDADLELDPAQLASLVSPVLDGRADVVYGSRFLAGRSSAPLLTFAANRVLTMAANVLYGSALTDMETCYKVMRVEVARSLGLTADRFDIEPQITARLLRRGHRIHELPVRFDPRSRAQGKKIGWRDGVRALQVPEPLALGAPWPDAPLTLAPVGHVPSHTVPGAIVPICPSGLYKPDDRQRYFSGTQPPTEYWR